MVTIEISILEIFNNNVTWIYTSNNHCLYITIDLIEICCYGFYLDIILLLCFVVIVQVGFFDFEDLIHKVVNTNNCRCYT